MIQPGELRIGNWVHLDSGNWSYRSQQLREPFIGYDFQWEDRDWYALGESTIDLEHISPILLTPEILSKCGFEIANDRYPNDRFGGYLAPEVNDERLRIRKDEFSFYYSTHEAAAPVRLQSFHQLQNLYYALTGTELNYKP